MMKRIVTYDVKKGNDYQAFYDYVEECNGEAITESTYLLNSDLKQNGFEDKLRQVFNKGDNVAYISVNDKNVLFYKKINI